MHPIRSTHIYMDIEQCSTQYNVVNEEIKKEIKHFQNLMKMKTDHATTYGIQ